MVRSLAELFTALDAGLSPEEKEDIRALAESDRWKLHVGLNALIRSIAFYRNESEDGKVYLGRLCIQPDDSSAVLGFLYWRHLRSLPMGSADVLRVLQNEFVLGTPAEMEQWANELSSDYAALAA